MAWLRARGLRRVTRDIRDLYVYFRGAEYPLGRVGSAWLAILMGVRGR